MLWDMHKEEETAAKNKEQLQNEIELNKFFGTDVEVLARAKQNNTVVEPIKERAVTEGM